MIPFSPPHIDQKVIDEVVSALKSGWITTGPRTKKFEVQIAEYLQAPKVLCLNSATAGLEVMLHWYGVGPGDEVIVPAYTYCATANVVVHRGAKPVFVDVNAGDFNISVDAIRKAITSRTKVIMPVDFGGLPCDYAAIKDLVQEESVRKLFVAESPNQEKLKRIMILSDAAHSFGATVSEKKCGIQADISVFSFHAVKNLTTAEGGAVVLNLPAGFSNEEEYAKLVVTTLHGQNKDALTKTKPGNWRYDIVEPGYKCNMTDISAAIGMVELSRYDSEILPRRKKICEMYSKYFSEFEWAELPVFTDRDKESSYHLYPLRIKNINEDQRDEIIRRIVSKEVSVNVHFIPVPMTSYYKSLGYDIKNYPVTYNQYSREISLPVYVDLSDDQIEIVCKAVSESVKEVLI